MGEPVRIIAVSHDLIRLGGRDPDSVPIKIVGLRPGEKLHEELYYAEEDVAPTEVAKVLRSASNVEAPAGFRADMDRFMKLARDGQDAILKTAVMDYVGPVDTRITADDSYRRVVSVQVGETEAVTTVGVPVGAGSNGSNGSNGSSGRTTVPIHTNGNGHAAVAANGHSAGNTNGNGARAPHGDAPVLAGRHIVVKPTGGNGTDGQVRPTTEAGIEAESRAD